MIEEYGQDHPVSSMLQRIQKMRKIGVTVELISADVSDRVSLEQAIQHIEKNLGSINGVIHAAGETVNGIISIKTLDSLAESYQAKVFGSYYLCELFQGKKFDFMVLCSSMNSIIGGLGQLDNTAANAFIDYLADYQQMRTGQNVFAINWGAVNVNRPMPVNVLHQFIDLSTEHKKNRMTDEEVNEVYTRILRQHIGSRVVVSTIDFNTILESWNRVSSIQELSKERQAYQQTVEAISSDQHPQGQLEQFVADCWQQLLGINAVGRHHNFFELGGHSLAAVQFITKIQNKYGLKFHVMNLYELPTLKEISHYLQQQLMRKEGSKSLLNKGEKTYAE